MCTLFKPGLVTAIVGLSCVVSASDKKDPGHGPKEDFIGVFTVQAVGMEVDGNRVRTRCTPCGWIFRALPIRLAVARNSRRATVKTKTTWRRAMAKRSSHSTTATSWYGTYSASVIVTPTTGQDGRVMIDGTYRNTGGTGSFEHAHGSGISAGVFIASGPLAGRGQIAVSGTL